MVDTPLTMDEQIATAAQVLLRPGGGAQIYEVLEQLASRYGLNDVWLVLQPRTTGPQVFRRARWSAPPEVVAQLVVREAGVYADPPVDLATSRAIAALCDATFRAAVAESLTAEQSPGLATRRVLEAALARAATRGARYGWEATAVLIGTAGEAPGAQRWQALTAALRAALRTGDEVGVAGPGLAAAILPHAGPDAVRPFVARVRAALNAAGAESTDLLVATASTPSETVDPAELRRLLRERFDAVGASGGETSGAVPAVNGAVDPADLWRLEVELRTMPGVMSVGLAGGRTADDGGFAVSLVAEEVSDDLLAAATDLVGTCIAGASVDLQGTGAGTADGAASAQATGAASSPATGAASSPATGAASSPATGAGTGAGGAQAAGTPPATGAGTNGHAHASHGEPASGSPYLRPGAGPTSPPLSATAPGDAWPEGQGTPTRVTLLRASFDPERGMSEVVLGLGSSRGTGRAPAGPLAGGAQATLTALAALGVEVPFYLVSAERARGVPSEPVVVVVAPRHPSLTAGSPERIGVAAGDDDVETASRATLGALNRHLAQSVVAR